MAQKPIDSLHREIVKCSHSVEQKIGKYWIYRCGLASIRKGGIPCTPEDWKICPSNDKRD